MRYQLAPLFCRPWTLNGITPRLIESHYENNYGGALHRLNAITEALESLNSATTPVDVICRLKRDESAALNCMLLHELYFASLGGDGRVVPDVMADAITRDFGSVDRWRKEFIALASGLAGGVGWILLTYVPRDRRLINQYASDDFPEHRRRHPDPGARHVRACLPPRLQRQCGFLHRWKMEKTMSFHARPISFKPPRLNGLSARLIASHYENNYGGAVRRLNAIRGELATLDPASTARAFA